MLGPPGVGVNTNCVVPVNTAPGPGTVNEPGPRVSTPTCTDCAVTFPSESVADTTTEYKPSGTTTPNPSRPSQIRLSVDCTGRCDARVLNADTGFTL